MTALHSPVAKALRAAGFLPLPRLWVTPADMDTIRRIALRHEPVVNAIRAAASAEGSKQWQIEQAWRQAKGMRE